MNMSKTYTKDLIFILLYNMKISMNSDPKTLTYR